MEQHYRDYPDRPYFASELGKRIRELRLSIPSNVRVINYIRSRLADRVLVVQDPQTPARIAVARPYNVQKVQRIVEGKNHIFEIHNVRLGKLPFALLAAFCRAPKEGMRTFFHLKKPFRYELCNTAPDMDYVEIPQSYQPEALRGADVHRLGEVERLELYRHIVQWSNDCDIDLHRLYIDEMDKRSAGVRNRRILPKNALERLLFMQDEEIRSWIRIPADLIPKSMLKLP